MPEPFVLASARRIDAQPPRKIAVLRALQLGDMLCAVPALRALRAAAPQAHITLIGLPWATAFVKRFSKYIDELLVFPGFPGFPEQPARLNAVPQFLSEAQRRRFDLAIQMHGSGSLSNPLTVLLGAEHNAGFFLPGQYCPEPQRFMPWDERDHEVLRLLRLMKFIGVAPQGWQLEFPLNDADYRALQRCNTGLHNGLPNAMPNGVPEPGSYVCIHPGARLASRRWLPQRFAEVGDRLAAAGMKVVLTGSAGESEVVRSVASAMRMPSLDLSGKTELGTLAALIARSRLVVANDTGVSHVAAAVATPSVIVSCGSDPRRWAPLDRARHHVLSARVSCRPCMHELCPVGHTCAQDVPAETVAALAQRILTDSAAPAAPAAPGTGAYP